MRGLRTRRHGGGFAGTRTGGAVAHGKDVRIARGLQRLMHHQLIDAIDFEPIQIFQPVRRLDAGCPDHELRRNEFAVREAHAFRGDLRDRRTGTDLYPKVFKQPARGCRDALRKSGQNAACRLDQQNTNVPLGIDAIESIGHDLARGAVELGGELGAGSARTYYCNVQLSREHRLFLSVRANTGIHDAPIEARGLYGRFQGDGMLRDTGSAEVVGDAADRNYQSIVGYRALGRDRASFLVRGRGQPNFFALAIEPDHLAEAVPEGVPMRLREIVELMLARVQAA